MASRASRNSSDCTLTLGEDVAFTNDDFRGTHIAPKPQIKLKVLSARQVNRIIMLNMIALVVSILYAILITILLNTVLMRLYRMKMPDGKVKYLSWYTRGHWFYLFNNLASALSGVTVQIVAAAFTIRVIRSRKKHRVAPGQIMTMVMVISLALSMSPMTYVHR